MNSTAILMMLVTKISIAAITIFFFVKILNAPKKLEETDEVEYPRGG